MSGSQTASVETIAGGAPAHSIACMEVWGGSSAFTSSVRVPGNHVHISCTPFEGGECGGDLYYISNCAAGLITRFILADVAGHGEQVAGIARDLRRIMRKHINTADQSRFAVELNSAFGDLELHGRFATAVLATYFAPTDHLIVCNAGHPKPLLYRVRTDAWAPLDAQTAGVLAVRQGGSNPVGIANLPLGILNPTEYEQFAVHLEPGDLVVLYTDALIEAAGQDGVQIGEHGLLELARGLNRTDQERVPAALRDRLLTRTGGLAPNDDATIIALEHTAEDPPHLSIAGHIGKFARMLGLGAIDSGPGQYP